jgi:glycine cleavage system H protein
MGASLPIRPIRRSSQVNSEGVNYRRSKFSTRLLTDRIYTAGHSWLKNEGDDLWRIGLTKFAIRMLGEAVEMDFEIGEADRVETGQVIGWIEGFKAVTDIYAPMDGTFRGANENLFDDMELLRRDPYDKGWIYSIEGKPNSSCIDIEGYMAVLDQTIDKMMGTPQEGETTSARSLLRRFGEGLWPQPWAPRVFPAPRFARNIGVV